MKKIILLSIIAVFAMCSLVAFTGTPDQSDELILKVHLIDVFGDQHFVGEMLIYRSVPTITIDLTDYIDINDINKYTTIVLENKEDEDFLYGRIEKLEIIHFEIHPWESPLVQ
ncbi:MAG: hypothetical protein RBS16_09830 [Candidatus Cloacimonadales bacterium]|jgi:hypothetical protein|nr:hypothetical protein [Candidatus Cloacimonadales bacterium]